MSTRPEHPPRELLSAFADGELDGDDRREVETHVADCAECRALLDDLALIGRALGELPVPPVPAGLEAAIGQRLDAGGAPRAVPATTAAAPRRAPRRRLGAAALALAATFAGVAVIGIVYRSSTRQELVPGSAPQQRESSNDQQLERMRSLGYVGGKTPAPSDQPLESAPKAKRGTKPSAPKADALPPASAGNSAGLSREERAGNRPDAERPAFAPAPPPPPSEPTFEKSEQRALTSRAPGGVEGQAAPRPQPRPMAPESAAPTTMEKGVADATAPNTIATVRPPAGHEDDLVVVLIGPDSGRRAIWETDAPDKARARLATVVSQFGGALGPAGPDGPGTMWVPRAKAAAFLDWLKRQGVTGLPDATQLNATGSTGIVRIEIR